MNFLTGLINYKTAINLLRVQFSKELKKDVKEFDLKYSPVSNIIKIVIDNKEYLFENAMLENGLKMGFKSMLKHKEKFVFLSVEVRNEHDIKANVYYIDANNERKFLTKTF
jgi:hypothetical protein